VLQCVVVQTYENVCYEVAVAVCCSVLQCVAVCCSVLQCVTVLTHENVCCGVALALCCSVLQCVMVPTHENVCYEAAVAVRAACCSADL